MVEYQDVKDLKSAANSAYVQIFRFDDIKKRAHTHASNSNNFLWNLELDNLWKELAPDLEEKYGGKDKDDYKKVHNEYNKFNQELVATFPLITGSLGHGFNKPSKNRQDQVSKQYNILTRKEVWLGELQNKLGKGTKWADQDKDAM